MRKTRVAAAVETWGSQAGWEELGGGVASDEVQKAGRARSTSGGFECQVEEAGFPVECNGKTQKGCVC